MSQQPPQGGVIVPIFPIPVLLNNINRNFTSEEVECAYDYERDVFLNTSNSTTNNLYVLNDPRLSNVKLFIESILRDYLIAIYNPINPEGLKLSITQSWFNYTKKEQSHHQHHHPNSIISGCLYFNADRNVDKIMFGRALPNNLQIQAKEQNMYTCVEAYFPVDKGDIVLFPSTLEHSVPTTSDDKTRISLAFNSFFSGKIGYLSGPLQGFNFLNITVEDQTIDNPYKQRFT